MRLTAASVALALAATLLPGLGLSLPDAPAGAGTVRDVLLPLEKGSVVGPSAEEDKLQHDHDDQGHDLDGQDDPDADGRRAAAVATWRSPPVGTGGARMLGLSWTGAEPAAVGVRAERGDAWSDWKLLRTDADGADAGSPDDTTPDRVFSQPLWLAEGTRAIEVQVSLPEAGGRDAPALGDLRAHLITPDMTPTPGAEPAGPGVAVARANAPAIISRERWGADERLRRGQPRYIRHVQVGFLHHTVQSNTYTSRESAALVRGVYLYHTQSQRFADVGYNFLVDRYGNIFEGRAGGVGQGIMGAHTGGFNHASFGVALIGDFDTSQVPSDAHRALANLFAWKMDLHHIDPGSTATLTSTGAGSSRVAAGESVRLNAVSGHRDAGRTACPGQHGYEFLDRLRIGVARTGLPKIYGGRVSRLSVRPGRETVTTDVSFSAHVNWSATVTTLDGRELRRWSGAGTGARLAWDGRTGDGAPAPPGVATLRVFANWRGLHARPVTAHLLVLR